MLPLQNALLSTIYRLHEYMAEQYPRELYPEYATGIVTDVCGKHHPNDSRQWLDLLYIASMRNIELYKILCVIRGCGAILVPFKNSYAIRPDFGNPACTWDKDSYAEIRELLIEHKDDIVAYLLQVKEWHNER